MSGSASPANAVSSFSCAAVSGICCTWMCTPGCARSNSGSNCATTSPSRPIVQNFRVVLSLASFAQPDRKSIQRKDIVASARDADRHAPLCPLPFKGRAGVGMVLKRVSAPPRTDDSNGTPSPPNPPLEGEGFERAAASRARAGSTLPRKKFRPRGKRSMRGGGGGFMFGRGGGRFAVQPATGEAGAFQALADIRIFAHDFPHQVAAVVLDHRDDRPLVDAEIQRINPAEFRVD